MNKFFNKSINLYFIGILLLDFSIYTKEIFSAQKFNNNENKLKKINLNLYKDNLNNQYFPLKRNPLVNTLKNDLFIQNTNLNKLLIAKNKEMSEIDILSDIQYEKENVFYAEGNVEITLGNAKLTGEKLSYDKIKKIFKIIGNVTFEKGLQYFEASSLVYNLNTDEGNIEDIYGIIDLASVNQDITYKEEVNSEINILNKDYFDVDSDYPKDNSLGLVNNIEDDHNSNIYDTDLKSPSQSKWRFKSRNISISGNTINSKKIYFTNDPFNKPQFILESRNFTGEIINEKIRLVSRNSWVILDDKIRLPVGRRSVYDAENIEAWNIGADFDDKDGWYLSRNFVFNQIFDDYLFEIKPYFLFQRALKGKTNSYRAGNSSILSEKVENDISASDLFAVDFTLTGLFKEWQLELFTNISSLDFSRLSESSRANFSLKKIIDLNKIDKLQNNKLNLHTKRNNNYQNLLKINLNSLFNEEISRGYSGSSEIYFGNLINFENSKSWINQDTKSKFSILYEFGNFNAQSRESEELINLSRNVFSSTFDYQFPIFTKEPTDKTIDKNYKYSSAIIQEGVDWISRIETKFFIYSNSFNQSAFSLSTGPEITFGNFKRDFLDYSRFKILGKYILKGGESPFEFDSIDDTLRIKFDFDQHLVGALNLSLISYLNLDVNDQNYGKFEKSNYGLNFQRRAYKLGAYYEPSSESVEVKFQIFNFGYLGFDEKF